MHPPQLRIHHWQSRPAWLMLLLAGIGLAWGAWPTECRAQLQERAAPTRVYNGVAYYLYDGNYKEALDQYRQLLRGGVRNGPYRWIDSICFYAMIGECYYHWGMQNEALASYTEALNLYLAFPDWMARVQFDAQIRPLTVSPQTPWGRSARGTQLGKYPQFVHTAQGQLDITETLRRGGQVQAAQLYPIQPQEIVRATALAIRRRTELLGPRSKYEPLSKQLVEVLSRPVGPRNHWTQAWVDLELGLAILATDKPEEAVEVLKRSVAAAGQFDHPMTGVALLELGRMAMKQGDYAGAGKLFIEATYAAYHYEDLITLEEAFRQAALVQTLSNTRAVFPPLAAAVGWARTGGKDLRHVRASLAMSAADNLLELGQTAQAASLLDEAQMAAAKRTMLFGAIGARLHYLRATQWFQQGKVGPGEEALAAALKYLQSGGSRWLFHVAQVHAFVLNSQRTTQMTTHRATDLYREVLRDPRPADWGLDPMESLAVLSTPHPEPLEQWFYATLGGVDEAAAIPAALEIADRLRRHRYFSTLPLGGRLSALRWVLEAPPEALGKIALVERQDLLARYPGYEKIARQASNLRAQWAALPAVPRAADEIRQQSALAAELAKLSVLQEAILREMAVRREPAELVFPPLRSTREVQDALPEGAAVLAFVCAGGQYHAFLLDRTKATHWVVRNPSALGAAIAALLREMGNVDANREVASKDLASPQWKSLARKVLDELLAGSQVDLGQKFPELIIVPDGMFWYLPFEALQVSVDDRLESLLSRFRIRYAPTLGLAVADARGRSAKPSTAVVLGRLYPRDADTVARAAYDELAKTLPGAVAIDRPLPGGSALGKLRMQHLVVLDDLVLNDQAPYAWSPIPLDRGKPGSTLADWMALPWGAPEVIVLPGYHTFAENTKKGRRGPPGSEVFLSLCGLLSTGTRTVLLTRWRAGGQSSVDLVREFLQELPHTTPSDAWQRAVLLLGQNRLNPAAEPRVKFSGSEELKGEHPFLWAGYLLVDCGDPVEKREGEADKKRPTVKGQPKPPGKKAAQAKPPLPPDEDAQPAKPADPPGAPAKPAGEEPTPKP